jgi:hypothetical protein
VPSERPAASERRATALSADGYQLPVHTAGFGLRMDPRFRDFGGTARLWMQRRLGAQFDVTRSTFTSGLTAGQLTTWQFSPSMLYALPDVVSSAVWVRPFAGGGLDLVRSSLGGVTPGMTTGHDRTFGTKILGGAEVTLPGAPQLTLSTEVGYHWLESSFTAFDLGGVRASVAAHWYVK